MTRQMKNIHRMLMIGLALLMLVTTITPIFADTTFTDVAANYWGRQHITKAAERGIVSGSLQNGKPVFKPEDPVTKAEALIMVYKTLDATDKLQSTENFTSKYKTVMESYNIPMWSFEAVAYALEYNILSGSELGGLMSGTQQTNATRQQVAGYLGKAMDPNAQASTTSSLTFIDREMIDTTALPYVQLLVNKGIISGDNNNRFNPKSSIKRVEMATVCSKAYDVLDATDIVVEVPVVAESKTETKIRTILDVKVDSVFVRDNDGNLDVYTIENTTEIFVNNSKSNKNNLSKDRRAHFTFDEDGKLLKIEMNPTEAKYEGYIDKINIGDSYDTITVRGDYGSTGTRTFRIYEDTEFEYENKSGNIRDLSVGDQITVVYEGDRAERIEAYSPMDELVGILEATIDYKKYPFVIKVKLAGNQVRELEIADNVRVRKDSKTKELTDLSRGDIVSIQLNGNKVTRIDASSVSGIQEDDKGIVQSIILGNPNKIVIVNEDNEEFTYDIDSNVTIYIDDTKSELYDLRVGYEVELEIENNRVLAIEADKVESRNSLSGEIVSVHDSINRVVVKNFDNTTKRYEEVPVFINKYTNIIDEDGKSIDMGGLYRRDEVFVSGEYDDGVFVATRIIVLN